MHNIKLKTLIKNSILVVIAATSLYICDANAGVSIGFGFGPAYFPEPYPDVVWVPGHWEDGYYVQGQYVQYGDGYDDNDYYGGGPGAVWFGFGGGGGHWHHGGGGFHGGWGGHHR